MSVHFIFDCNQLHFIGNRLLHDVSKVYPWKQNQRLIFIASMQIGLILFGLAAEVVFLHLLGRHVLVDSFFEVEESHL